MVSPKVTKCICHLQNLFSFCIYLIYCKNNIFIDFGQVVDDISHNLMLGNINEERQYLVV
ncbi:hypothetical protein C7G54_17410 [Acinetobacter baumannii]|nr:hypothetical protein EGM95_20270 [Acinetobacter baumannii]PSD72577.1 hypothetical protein C7G49_16450 [Acinetobacter pittii]KAA8934125.1 hypothetical protein DLI75_06155 [Acinetobacter baumannii]KAA8939763.1 hypothetical protein DLI74_02730 [Acinetobacter baumannii]MBR8559384.1 hypothetical protein [Acinetobacter baumannii]